MSTITNTQKDAFDAMLAQQYFLSGLDEGDRDRLIANAVQWTLKPGQTLFARMSRPAAFFVVLAGRVWPTR